MEWQQTWQRGRLPWESEHRHLFWSIEN
jgi:hypothetical protein